MNPPHPLPLRLCRLAATDAGQLADADALRRYVTDRDAAAFEVLVWRHGPMVWGVVRRVLRHDHDAEDAFQATFLALAREASRVEGVAGWLHRAAFHVALKTKSKRPRSREAPAERAGVAPDTVALAEVGVILDTEINRLPERYRSAFVLCCLEGKSNTEASQELGCPTGTIDSRLNWARQRLRDRLTRRGVTLAALAPGILAPELAHAAVVAVTTPRTELLPLALAGVRAMNRTVAKVIGVSLLAASVLIGVTSWALSASSPPAPRPEVAAVVPVVAPVPKEKPENVETSLLLIEDVSGPTGTVDVRRLVRVRFKAGVAGKPEVLHSDEQRFYSHFGGHRVHDNRYVVTKFGSVLDLKGNTWIHKETDGDVLTIEGGRVIYRMTNVTKPEGIFAFDLTKKTVEKVAGLGEPPWIGTRSPDGKRSVYAGKEAWELMVFSPTSKPISLGQGFGFSVSPLSSSAPSASSLPVLWLDDNTILTLTANDRLVTVNLKDQSRTEIVRLKSAPQETWIHRPPTLSRDANGTVLYEIGREVYRINVAAKSYERTDRQPLGYGFEFLQTTPWLMAQVILHNGKELERVPNGQAMLSHFAASDHYFGMVVHEQEKAQKNTRRIRVWSAATGKWTTHDIPANSLVGWVK